MALDRGVHLIVVIPNNSEDSNAIRDFQKYQRDVGINYLKYYARSEAGSSTRPPAADSHEYGTLTVASLHAEEFPATYARGKIYVHSKLMIVDDEFVCIGSANFARRSMTHDGEVSVGIVDRANLFAGDLRKELWWEHMRPIDDEYSSAPDIRSMDALQALPFFRRYVAEGRGHLFPYSLNRDSIYMGPELTGGVPFGHANMINNLIDPYAGPGTVPAEPGSDPWFNPIIQSGPF